MKILLINPPFNRLKRIDNAYFPLGLGYIAAVLEKEGFDVKIYNDVGEETKTFKYDPINRLRAHTNYVSGLKDPHYYVWKEIEKVIEEFKPTIVGITTSSEMYASALKVAEITKNVNPDIKVIIGGVHVTSCPDAVIKEENINIAVRGEGEYSMLEICQALKENKDLNHIQGISFKKDNKIIKNPDREFIQDLDKLPLPARHLLLYPHLDHNTNVLITTRGCPFCCTYCSSPHLWKRKLRKRSPENILKEIKYIVEDCNAPFFQIWDDTFTANKENAIKLCRLLIQENIHKKATWEIANRVDTTDEKVLKWLRKANCTKIDLGIEFGSQKMLDISNKGITKDQIKSAVKMIKKYNFLVHTFWMLGFPEENEDDIKQSIEFLKELNPDCALVNVVIPHPKTEVNDQLAKMGLIKKDYDWKIPLNPARGYTKIPDEKFDALLKEYLYTARQKTDKNVKKILKKAYLYRKRIYKNPKNTIKLIRDRIFDIKAKPD